MYISRDQTLKPLKPPVSTLRFNVIAKRVAYIIWIERIKIRQYLDISIVYVCHKRMPLNEKEKAGGGERWEEEPSHNSRLTDLWLTLVPYVTT